MTEQQANATNHSPIDPKTFWRALSARACGTAIVTSEHEGKPAGFLALSVTHLTADPPTVMVSVSANTSALASIRGSGTLAINYLAQNDAALADVFSGKAGLKGADRFEPERWETLVTGAPVLKSALGAVDCVVEEMIERHATFIVLARIVGFRNREDGSPLIHFRGKFA